ncbi:DNA translocase FtsK [Chelonus insularis]|uniref:DNA translocase FtsK n=1 Tax=Chelonus insularis TaxID=460826 RepID=UPI00158972A4|nr:DNA translocase FtsK [Chelonus insularis]
MKVLIISALIALTLAEPPSYRQQFQNRDRIYYFAKQQEVDAPEAADAPYAPSGWRPDGPSFEYPQKQQQLAPQQQYGEPANPQNQYGAPAAVAPESQYGAPATVPERQYGSPAAAPESQYGAPATARQRQFEARKQYKAPQQNYGAPQFATESSTTTIDDEEQTTFSTATESQAEPVDSVNELDDEGNVDEQSRQAGQYFIALPDGRLQRVQYVSRQDLEAMKYFAKIRAENVEPLRGPIYAYQPLQKLQFAPAQLEVVAEPAIPFTGFGARENTVANRKNNPATPAKLQVQPVAAEIPATPLTSSLSGYSANYQTPSAEQRFLISF